MAEERNLGLARAREVGAEDPSKEALQRRMEEARDSITNTVTEIKEEASAYARGITMIAIGAVIAVVGFALLNVAIAFAVSTLFAQANFSQPASFALGFVVTGAFYLILGAILVMLMKSRLAKQELVPQRTVQELRKDKQWLKNEI